MDGVAPNDFAIDPKPELRRLARDLRLGEFKFSPLRPHLIPKTSGKDRLICVPTVRDRIVQRAILEYLTPRYLDKLSNDISYGFVKGRTVQQAAALAGRYRTQHPWVFKTDITSFFDQIDRTRLGQAVRRYIRQSSLHALLDQAASCEIASTSKSTRRRVSKLGIEHGRGVRQGMPLSPFFANVILDDFDRSVITAGFLAIRYADDLVFFADGEEKCKTIHAFCRDKLAPLGLSIPDIGPDLKSTIYSPAQSAEFLGLGLCKQDGKYVLRVMPKQVEKIKESLLHLSNISELLSRKITLARLGSYIENRIAGYLNAYEMCANIEEFEHEISNFQKKVLRKLYADGLGIDLGSLSKEGRTFLGIS